MSTIPITVLQLDQKQDIAKTSTPSATSHLSKSRHLWAFVACFLGAGIVVAVVSCHSNSPAANFGTSHNIELGIKPVSPSATFTVVSSSSTQTGDYYCTGEDDEVVINAALQNLQGDGIRELVLTEGTFTISDQILLTGNTRIRGAGLSKTTITVKDNPPSWKKAGMLRGFRIDNIEFKDLTVDGNRGNQTGKGEEAAVYGRFGFYCEVCDGMVFDSVRVTNHYGYGFDPHGEGGTINFSKNLRIENCIADNNGWDGITVDKTATTLISNTVVKNNGRHGINVVTGSIDTEIKNCVIEDNGFFYYDGKPGNGIMVQDNQLYNTKRTFIHDNTIKNSKGRGININDSFDDRVEKNIVDQSGDDNGYCGRFANTTNLQLYENTCTGGDWILEPPSVNFTTSQVVVGWDGPLSTPPKDISDKVGDSTPSITPGSDSNSGYAVQGDFMVKFFALTFLTVYGF